MGEEQNEQVEAAVADLAAVRMVVLAAYPDSVPELVQGATVSELLASVEPARAAYARVAESVAPVVEPTAVVDPGSLPAAEKVRRGIAGMRRG